MNQFYARLHARKLDTSALADLVNASRPAVTRVLNGARRRGPLWTKLAAHLRPEEIKLLDVAHCHPWNNRRVEKRPKWTHEKAEAFAS
jgi:hypothetical protein